MAEQTFDEIGVEIGQLLKAKNAAYGNSFEEAEKIIRILFPDGIPAEQYQDFLTVIRIIDKLFRIANDKTAFMEDPWKDIAGYAILALWSQRRRTKMEEDRVSAASAANAPRRPSR